MDKIIEWLSYPSTWKGIISALTIIGVKVAPDQAELIITAGVSVVTMIWSFFSDSDVKPKK